MTDATRKVLDQIRTLPRSEQEVVLAAIIDSLDGPSPTPAEQTDVDVAWSHEIRRRVAAYRNGTATLIDADEVFATLRTGVATMKVRFDAGAADELRTAVEYYDGQNLGLGDAFEAEVRDAINRVVQLPQGWPLVEEGARAVFS
ncbi:MAG: putative addiction module component [Phycisphaerales bacterium]|nr:putative addiction module component [Phycisphaerales bacterium]